MIGTCAYWFGLFLMVFGLIVYLLIAATLISLTIIEIQERREKKNV